MPTTAFALIGNNNISLYAPLAGVGTDKTSEGFIFVATGTDCSIRVKNSATSSSFWGQFRVDGGAWQVLGTNTYPVSGGVSIFAGLSDSDHVVDVRLLNPANYSTLVVDTSTPPLSVSGAAPAIKYAPGFGATVSAQDADPALPVASRKWQFGGGAADFSATPTVNLDSNSVTAIFARVPNSGSVTAVTARVRGASAAVTTIDVYHKATPTQSARFVGTANITTDGYRHDNVTVACSPPLVGGDIVLLVGGSSATLKCISLAGITGILPALGTNIWKDAVVSGTSLTTQSGTSPSNYPAILCASLGYMAWNYGYPGSQLNTGANSSVIRESLLESVGATLWIEAQGQNEAAGSQSTFRTDLTAHISRVLTAQQSTYSVATKVLVLGLETPNTGALDPSRRAAFLGTAAAPGAAILSVNDTNTAFGAGRAFYLESSNAFAAIQALPGGWSLDNLHPNTQAATAAIAGGLFPQAALALGIVNPAPAYPGVYPIPVGVPAVSLYNTSVAVTPSDYADVAGGFVYALSASGAGVAAVVDTSGGVQYLPLTPGLPVPIRARRVLAIGTTATGITGYR